MDVKPITVIEHLEELRKRLFIVAICFIAAVAAGFWIAEPIIQHIQYSDEAQQLTLNAFSPLDPLSIYFQVIFIVALVLSSPILFYQLWAFISPGLHAAERKITLAYIPFIFLLFLGGVAFSYYVLFPFVMRFTFDLSNRLEIEQTIGINEYFTFLFQLTLPFGLLFQLPVVLLFLARLGILRPDDLVKIRKYAYFGLFVAAAIIAPPELMSHLIVSVPLFILYEVSIVISRFGYKKYVRAEQQRQREQEAREAELQQMEQRETIAQLLAEQRRQIELANDKQD